MNTHNPRIVFAATLTAAMFTLTGCDKGSPNTSADRIEKAADRVEASAKKAASKTEDAVTRVTNSAEKNAQPEVPGSTELKIKGDWNVIKGRMKQKFADLTDDDLLYVEGKEQELYGRLQKRLGKTRAEVDALFEE